MRIKNIIILLFAIMLITVFYGCSKANDDQKDTNQETVKQEQTEEIEKDIEKEDVTDDENDEENANIPSYEGGTTTILAKTVLDENEKQYYEVYIPANSFDVSFVGQAFSMVGSNTIVVRTCTSSDYYIDLETGEYVQYDIEHMESLDEVFELIEYDIYRGNDLTSSANKESEFTLRNLSDVNINGNEGILFDVKMKEQPENDLEVPLYGYFMSVDKSYIVLMGTIDEPDADMSLFDNTKEIVDTMVNTMHKLEE